MRRKALAARHLTAHAPRSLSGLAVASELKLPIRFIGVGETAEDFDVFDAGSFVDAVLAPATETRARA